MSFDKVKAFFESQGAGDKVLWLEQSSATVELAAEAVGCEPARIAKTLSFLVDEQPILILTAGDVKVDNKKYKELFHTKAKMLSPDQALALTGHAVGGVCPFALPETVRIFLDESLRRFETVYPAAGSSNSAVEVTPAQLESYTNGIWVDVCKLREE